MQASEAAELVRDLCAAFRPRDWTDRSSAIYVEALLSADWLDGQVAVRELVRTSRFFPAVVDLLDEIADAATLRTMRERGTVPALPSPSWTEDDETSARTTMERVMDDWRAKHPDAPTPNVETFIGGYHHRPTIDTAEVERRREQARRAKARLKDSA